MVGSNPVLTKSIDNGTIFIVFDMEWNQPFAGKQYYFDVSALNGEIIEIGAIKYEYQDGKLIERGVFSCDIKPRYYTTIHYHVRKVTHKTNADLRKGIDFEDAYKQFRDFCGEDSILVGWGTSDPGMLKTNLKFMYMDSNLNMDFVDIQPVFSLFAGEKGKQKSVEFAVDYYQIEKSETFHSATADAKYTGEILKAIYSSNDYKEVNGAINASATNPDIKHEYTFVGSESESMNAAFEGAMTFAARCPICDGEFVYEVEPFRIRKTLYGVGICEKDGKFFARSRLKKAKSGKYYASAIVRFASPTDLWLVEDKSNEFKEFGPEGRPVVKSEGVEDEKKDEETVNKNE